MSAFPALRRAGVRNLCTAVSPSSVTAKSLSISQIKNRLRYIYDPDEALKLYTSFAAAAADADLSASSSSLRFAQEVTVRRLVKADRFSDIQNFLESHKSKPQIKQEPFLSSLIRSYGVARLLENAVSTYNEMTQLGTPRSSLSFNCLLTACIDCKALDRVPAYFSEFPAKFGFEPDEFSYGILIKAYCLMDSPEKAMKKLDEMEEKGIKINAISFTTILHALYKKGQVDEAAIFWNEMVKKRGVTPDQGSYNVRLLHIYKSNGKMEDVKALIGEMEGAGLKPDTITFNYLMTGYCLNGQMDEAKEVYDNLLNAKGLNPNAGTFRTLVFHLCRKELYMTAYKVFKTSVNWEKIPNFGTLKVLLEGLVKKGHTAEAKAMDRILNKRFNPKLLVEWREFTKEIGLDRTGVVEVDSITLEKEVESGDAVKAVT